MTFKVFFFLIDLICKKIEEPPMKLASWTLQNFDGYRKSLKWSSQSRPMTGFVGKVAISLIFDGFVACLAAPLVLWVPEGLRACAAGCRPVRTD